MKIDFNKGNGLVPVIVQDDETLQVLMLGYMNEEAYTQSCISNRVTFFSRSKKRLWVKGETSGNFLDIVSMNLDCDNDAILIKANAVGPTCHKGTASCFGENENSKWFIYKLEKIISQRVNSTDSNSYTKTLFDKGINKVAQKVGEEAIELVIESKDDNDALFKNEAADLFYHYLILLQKKGFKLNDIENVLESRNHIA